MDIFKINDCRHRNIPSNQSYLLKSKAYNCKTRRLKDSRIRRLIDSQTHRLKDSFQQTCARPVGEIKYVAVIAPIHNEV